jgi:hypothetical protein
LINFSPDTFPPSDDESKSDSSVSVLPSILEEDYFSLTVLKAAAWSYLASASKSKKRTCEAFYFLEECVGHSDSSEHMWSEKEARNRPMLTRVMMKYDHTDYSTVNDNLKLFCTLDVLTSSEEEELIGAARVSYHLLSRIK